MITTPRRAVPVVLALSALIILAGLLLGRLVAVAGPPAVTPAVSGPSAVVPPPPATVPPPAPLPSGVIEIPCWSCPQSQPGAWPIRFRTDLDLLAPLGTGTQNAALWFKDFDKTGGSRLAEAEAAQRRRVDHPKVGQVLPADDPLLREAEPWVDQATMRFYPEILPLEGFKTRIPNLLLGLTFAKSWIARGMDTPDSEVALADFRRAIRLGRLLRQEDVTLISDLVGLACVRIGTEAICERAARNGNDRLALVAAIAVGEAAPQRLLSAARITESELAPYLGKTLLGRPSLDLPDFKLDKLVERAKAGPDRRLRFEPMCTLAIVRELGTSRQQARMTEALEELGRSDDPIIAAHARYFLSWSPSSKELQELVGQD